MTHFDKEEFENLNNALNTARRKYYEIVKEDARRLLEEAKEMDEDLYDLMQSYTENACIYYYDQNVILDCTNNEDAFFDLGWGLDLSSSESFQDIKQIFAHAAYYVDLSEAVQSLDNKED